MRIICTVSPPTHGPHHPTLQHITRQHADLTHLAEAHVLKIFNGVQLEFRYCVCVFYYCRTYYKAVRVGGGGEWRTCAMRDDEPRPGTREEPGTLTQGASVFPGSSRLGIEPKTPRWLVQDPTTRQIGDLIPTIGGSGAHPGRGWCSRLGIEPKTPGWLCKTQPPGR